MAPGRPATTIVTARARRRVRIRSNLLGQGLSIPNRTLVTVAALVAACRRAVRSRHSSLARTASCAGSPSSAASEHMDRSGRPRCRRRGRLLLWTVAGRRWPTAGLPRGQGRGGLAVAARLVERRNARIAGHERRGDAVLVGGPGEDRILRGREDPRDRSRRRDGVGTRGGAVRPRARRGIVGRSRLRAVANWRPDATRCGRAVDRAHDARIRRDRHIRGRRFSPTAGT